MKINKKIKIWKACAKNNELRPSMEHIFFKNGHAYASDAHILVKIPLEALFKVESWESEEQLEKLNGYSIHSNLFQKLTKYDTIWVDTVDDRTVLKVKFEEQTIAISLKDEGDVKPLNFEAILPHVDAEPVTAIGINYKFLSNLTEAMGIDGNIELHFTKKNQKVFVETAGLRADYPTMKGLIMPVLIN